MSDNRRFRRANFMKTPDVQKALESDTPLNSLYALIPERRRKALNRLIGLFGKNPIDLRKALQDELNDKQNE